MKPRGFTLIELLIVVAIIAILAAIALPNFLEAQARSKVARAVNDMRAIATAVESYATEYNSYPTDPDDDPNADLQNPAIWDQRRIFVRLTTPIPFLTSFYYDPFNTSPAGGVGSDPMEAMMTQLLFPGQPPYTYSYNTDTPPGTRKPVTYGLTSLGPNLIFDSYRVQYYPDRHTGLIACMYDPTNGTTSAGDIIRYSQGLP